MHPINIIPNISSDIFGSNPIKTTPNIEEKISNHCIFEIFSSIKIELNKIAKGIDSGAIITIGAIIFEASTDKYKNKFTAVPIDKVKTINGSIYFLFIF